MDYYCYDIKAPDALKEIALAFLSELPFDSFEEAEDGLCAYLRMDQHSDWVESELSGIADRLSLSYERRLIPSRNWNKLWESNFSPIRVGDFCGVRADFHEPMERVEYEIVISPRMAFGTGHHATTYMMIERMAGEDFHALKVLDYGCGTGILAILADKMGAAHIDAVDIEKAAYENTLDNARANDCGHISAFHGT
ncbi:MAG: 50S ribosomal protein L11 methyltransferase, partial [Phaeodactylibacter sp.]|nr:50S ribosomal protein L11 methyltransferase [Phaeodactylibacter sp.]